MRRRAGGFGSALEGRLRSGDLIQVLTLYLAVLAFVLVMRWPVGAMRVNESWFAFAQTRLVLLALIALGYGSLPVGRPPLERAATGAALLVVALVAAPFDVASYAASFPATPLWWSLLVPLIDTAAFYGLGLALGATLGAVRLRAMVPLAVPALLVGMVLFDVRTGVRLLNPLSASVEPSYGHLAVMAGLALATALALAIGASRRAAPEAS